jgi:hypothetical protein
MARVAVAEGGEPAEACIMQLLRVGAMPRRGVEGMGLMEGHAVGAGGGATTVIQRECVWRRGGGEGGNR